VTSLPAHCFGHCTNLSSISLHEGINEIGEGCFYYCHSLKSFTVLHLVTSLPADYFVDCTNLSSIILHEGINEIGVQCFSGYKSLHRLFLPRSLLRIKEKALENRSSFRITIPNPKTEFF
jgi:hypothetical protein